MPAMNGKAAGAPLPSVGVDANLAFDEDPGGPAPAPESRFGYEADGPASSINPTELQQLGTAIPVTRAIGLISAGFMGTQEPKIQDAPPYDEEDLYDILEQNKDAKKLWDAADGDGFTIRWLGPKSKYYALYDPGNSRFLINRYKLPTKEDGAMALLYELIRHKHREEKAALVQKVKDGKITAEEYAVENERLSYKYMKEQSSIIQKGVKEGKWKPKWDKFGKQLQEGGDFDTFEKYLEAQKTLEGGAHYKNWFAQYEAILKEKQKEEEKKMQQ
jgi:hypothetical protein